MLEFVDGRIWPHLNRLPQVLGLLCFRLRTSSQEYVEMLAASIPASDVSLISESCGARDEEISAVSRSLYEKLRLWEDLSFKVDRYVDRGSFQKILRERDFEQLAGVSDHSSEEIRSWAEAAAQYGLVHDDMDQKLAALLKKTLPSESWIGLRQFLLERLSPDVAHCFSGYGVLVTEL